MIDSLLVCVSPADHMYIEEYIEEDEEPPLLLSSCPSHGEHVCLCRDKMACTSGMKPSSALVCSPPLTHDLHVCVCVCLPGARLWWDCRGAVSVGGRVCVSAMPCGRRAHQGETINWNKVIYITRAQFAFRTSLAICSYWELCGFLSEILLFTSLNAFKFI